MELTHKLTDLKYKQIKNKIMKKKNDDYIKIDIGVGHDFLLPSSELIFSWEFSIDE